MSADNKSISIYLETGAKRTVAGALDWPGWCRVGRDEASALQALFDYAPRYAQVMRLGGISFHPPADLSALAVSERLAGNSSTDYGVPGLATAQDALPATDADLTHFTHLLDSCWQALDAAEKSAQGKELRKGPRGGGRELEEIIRHVIDSAKGYLSTMGYKLKDDAQLRAEIPLALQAQARGELPKVGPRGGARWSARYFVRRTAWHILDHAWEIEDRSMGE